MRTTYQSKNYSPDKVTKRYIRKVSWMEREYIPITTDEEYRWCEVGQDTRYDIRQGYASADEVPDSIKTELVSPSRVGTLGYVEWPL